MDMKVFLGLMIAAQLFAAPAVIETVVPNNNEVAVEIIEKGEEPGRSEEFMWFYRWVNGKQQKRLWSLTYGYWVTDWIDCE